MRMTIPRIPPRFVREYIGDMSVSGGSGPPSGCRPAGSRLRVPEWQGSRLAGEGLCLCASPEPFGTPIAGGLARHARPSTILASARKHKHHQVRPLPRLQHS